VGVTPIYIIIFITGLARGFMSPALSTFTAQLIPKELFGNASRWNSLVRHSVVIAFSFCGLVFYYLDNNNPVPEKLKVNL